MTIDSHQHFWVFDSDRDTWMTPGTMNAIRKDFLPSDIKPILDRHHIDGCVSVQADQSDAETQFLLAQASENDFVKGVVGWIDLKGSDLRDNLISYKKEKKLVGFRHIIQSEPKGFMLDEDFIEGLHCLAETDYTYDLLIYWYQLEEAIEMIKSVPAHLNIVLDHIAKPNIRDGRILKWEKGMEILAGFPNVYCKVSGLVTEAHWQYWKTDDLDVYLERSIGLFGIDRCMFGSDWPVCTLAATYQEWVEYLEILQNKFSAEELAGFWGENCARFYKLN